MIKHILLDLDGSLCDDSARRHLLPNDSAQKFTKEFEPYHDQLGNDELNTKVWDRSFDIAEMHEATIELITGRSEKYRKETETWLRKFPNIVFNGLTMRTEGDVQSTASLKVKRAKRIQDVYRYEPLQIMLIDDKPEVILDFMREGYLTLWIEKMF